MTGFERLESLCNLPSKKDTFAGAARHQQSKLTRILN
jgi:hypothetical protein